MSRASTIREAVAANLPRRHRAEQRFRAYGLVAIVLSVLFLALLLGSILVQSVPAFTAHRLVLPVSLDRELVDPRGDLSEASLRRGSYNAALQAALRDQFPDVEGRATLRELYGLYNPINAARLLATVVEDPNRVGRTVDFEFPISDDVDRYLKGQAVDETRWTGSWPITVERHDEGVTLTSESPVFADLYSRLRDERERRAQAVASEPLDSGTIIELGPRDPSVLVRIGQSVIRLEAVLADGTGAHGQVIIPGERLLGEVARWTVWEITTPAATRLISDRQIAFARLLQERGFVQNGFNSQLFANADSRDPELAGVSGAFIGSLLTMVVTMLMAVPVGVGAAIYLEEFAPKNRLTAFIEVNINNLAAVPSIVFGLLGLAVFINGFGLPRSTPLVGGMVLALMTLPTVIISSRAALKAVPPSIREAALGVGASRTQAVFHHVLPLALPGMLTGAIIGLAQALGETAPLLMIGMVAFVADTPSFGFVGFSEPATVMPVQVYLWATSAERAFEARAAAAVLVLLAMMIFFNAVAIYLRRRYERRW